MTDKQQKLIKQVYIWGYNTQGEKESSDTVYVMLFFTRGTMRTIDHKLIAHRRTTRFTAKYRPKQGAPGRVLWEIQQSLEN